MSWTREYKWKWGFVEKGTFCTPEAYSFRAIWMLTFQMLIFLILLFHLKPETLKLWKLHLTFLLLVIACSELDISNVDISHITLSPHIWNLKTLKPSLQIFAVYLFLLNLTFRMLTFPMLLCREAYSLSKTKCAVF